MSKEKTNWHNALIMFINDECPPGKDFEKCSFTANCSGCWDTWIERQEKVVDKPKTIGDMTLREVREYCHKHQECDKCVLYCNLSGYDCEFDVDAPAGLDDETLNKTLISGEE